MSSFLSLNEDILKEGIKLYGYEAMIADHYQNFEDGYLSLDEYNEIRFQMLEWLKEVKTNE